MTAVHRDKIAWLLFTVAFLISGWLTFTNLSEFIIVGILKQTSGYPFGGEGSVPRYYQTAQMYATVNLVFGLLFLSVCIISCLSFVRNEKKFLAFINTVILLLVFLELLMGQTI